MIRQLFLQAVVNFASVPDIVARTVKETALLIDTSVADNGYGEGVLIGPQTALTSLHNFSSCPYKKASIVRPFTDEKTRIVRLDRIPQLDIGILRLRDPLAGPYAEFENHVPSPFSLVLKPHLSVQEVLQTGNSLRVSDLSMIKGMLLAPEIAVGVNRSNGVSESWNASIFHLKSSPGDSGAGIFSIQGKLLTLNATGKEGRFSASGPTIEKFIDLAQRLDLTR